MLAALLAFSVACSKGNESIDKFIGDSDGATPEPAYALDFDPPSYDFGSLITTATTPLNKSVTVKNNTGVTLFLTSVTGTASPHFTMVSETCTSMTTGMTNGSSCSMVVEFLPRGGGLHNFAVNIAYGLVTGATDRTGAANFLGTGALPADLIISDGPTFNFGDIVVTAVAEKSLTVTNAGNIDATGLSGAGLAAPFDFKGGSYPGVGGTCGAALAASTSCTLVVTFSPAATGVANDAIELTYHNGDTVTTSTRNITGNGATPAVLSISDAPGFDYGTYAVGATADKAFTINNSGGVSAIGVNGTGLNAPFVFKGGGYPGVGGTCGATIASGATCTVVASFAPGAVGTFNDDIEINYNDGLNAQMINRAVQGTAVTPAALTISNGPAYDYGTLIVTGTADAVLTVTNTGDFNASFVVGSGLAAPFSFKGGTFPGTGGTCASSLVPAANCTVVVTYAPTAAGSYTNTLRIDYSNGATAQNVTRVLQGLAVNAAALAISDGPTYDYGTRPTGSSTDKSFTITNTGGTPATLMLGTGLAAPYSFKGGSYPGTGGTCAATLNPSSTCSVVITYAPATTGTHADALEMNYDNGLSAVMSSRPITALGVAPANLAISDGPTYDYGQQPIGKSTDKTFTITNTGGFGAASISGSGLASPFSFKGGVFPGMGGNCGTTLAAGANCQMVVTYAVSAAATDTDTIEIGYNDGVAVQGSNRDVIGTGVTPASVTITDGPAYDFGAVATGKVVEKTLTLANAGTFNATGMTGTGLAAPFTFKGGTYPGTGGTCGNTLVGGANCTVVVAFAPVSTGTLSDTLEVYYFNGVNAQLSSRALQGVGTLPATLAISDGPTYSFGTLAYGASSIKSFTVTNIGGVSASTIAGTGLAAPFTFVGGAYPGTGGDCGTALAPSGTCTITVEYNPTLAGTHSDTIEINYFDDVNNQSSTRNVAGIAVTPANLGISHGPTYNFGLVAVGGASEVTLTVTNSGQFAASAMSGGGLALPYIFKGGTYPGTGGTCSSNLNAGLSCTIVVRYSPSATGTQTDTVDLSYFNGASAQVSNRDLSGTGAAPASLAISDGPLHDYGSVATGGFADKTFTINNSGGVAATSITGSGLASPYTFKGGTYPGTGATCGAILNAGATCTITVTYSPSATGASADTIDVSYNNGASAQTASRDVQGMGVNPASLSFSDGPTFDYGAIPATGSSEKIFTVTNSGNYDASAMNGAGLAAPFTFKGGAYPGTGGSCGVTLAMGATCTVVVVFAPATVNTFSDTIELTYFNGATSPTALRGVQGVGATAGSLTISDGPTFNFGSWPNGDTREKVFTVTNGGGVPATAITGGGLASPYTFKGGAYPGTGATCAAALNAGASCTIVVQYSPSVLGTSSDTIELNYHNGLIAAVSNRDVTGTSVPPADLTISDGATYDFGTVAVGASAQKSLTITNSGGVTATA
ncbi:MAG TPA: choice-of-anchor D domain-containing protein, partial [Bdellovibrionales bacterium]|nr:choice-of-anchor D domain-containing protein [Bdellovibrionales bacterium]